MSDKDLAHAGLFPPVQNPVRVDLQLEPAAEGLWPEGAADGLHSRAGRKLLDAEKIMFRTDSQGRVGIHGSQVQVA